MKKKFSNGNQFYNAVLRILILSLFILFQLGVYAQNGKIKVSGKVFDSSGITLPGVTVLEKGTTNGAITNVDGVYNISVNADAVLVFSFVGMSTKEIPVNSQTILDVVLDQETVGIEEVVAIGYGTQTKTTITAATSTIKGESLNQIPTNTVSSKLQGQLAGVSVQTISGQPGNDLQIRIRGGSSINKSNDPLVLVDGFQRTMSDINPSDIESIDILKDASATAIYGSRASNGVVLITTKRGKAEETQLNLDVSYGIQDFNRQYDLLDATQYLQWWRPRVATSRYGTSSAYFVGAYPTATGNDESSTWTPRFLQDGESVPDGWKSMIDPVTGNTIVFEDTDLQEILFRKAPQVNLNLSATGGTKKLKFATDLGYTDQDGVAISTNYQRLTGRVNLDFEVNDKIKISTNTDMSYSKSNSFDNEAALFTRGSLNAPTIRERFEDGTAGWGTNATLANPQWVVETRDVSNQRFIGTFGVNASWKILKDLTLSGSNFYQVNLSTYDYFLKANHFNESRDAEATRNIYSRRQTEALLKYTKTLVEKHNIDFLLGYTDLYMKTDAASLAANGGASDKIQTLNAAPTKLEASTSISEERLISQFLRLNYNYDLKYLVSLSLRRDGSSKFGSGNRFGYFPSASLGWVLSNEDFFPKGETLNFLKLRASYGITGNNDIGRYVAQGTYNTGYTYGGNAATLPTAMPNTALTWEKTKQTDIGVEIGLLKQRKIEVTADIYKRETEDLLFTVQLPRESGFSSVEQNVGVVEYKGFEFSLTTRNISRQNFLWTTRFNFAYNINKVIKLPYREGVDNNRINGTVLADGSGFGGIAEGERLGSIVGYKVDYLIDNAEQAANALYDESANGYDPVTGKLVGRGTKFAGDFEWIDRNGDGKITSLDQFVIGYKDPTTTGGLMNDITYGDFTLNVFMDYALGHTVVDMVQSWMDGNKATRVATTTSVLDAWTHPGDAAFTNQPRSDFHDQNHQANLRTSDFYATRGDYLCLRNVTLAYHFPQTILHNKLRSLQLFMTGNNLYYLTKYKGPNPERGGEIGHQDGKYPPFRTFTIGAKIGL